MDKRELADQYISEVQKDIPQLTQGPGLLSVALIRACEDLLICKDEFARYKTGIVRERQEDLARALGIPADALASYCKEETLLNDRLRQPNDPHRTPQDRSGAEHPPVSTDPQGTQSAPRHGPASLDPDAFASLLDSVPPPSPIRCPNCGEWATYAKSSDDVLVYCTHCDYEEKR